MFKILIKLLFGVFAVVFLLSLLVAGLVAVVVSVVWSLLTGRKPKVFTTVTRFRQASQQFRQGRWSPSTDPSPAAGGDVVDVQAHEVSVAPSTTDRPTTGV